MAKRYLKIQDFSLKQFNSMRLSARSSLTFIPFEVSGVEEMLSDYNLQDSVIIGNGSNIIFSKEQYDVPFILSHLMNHIEYNENNIVCDSGVSLSQLAWFALEHSAPGYEFMEDIPGSVGGGLFMNAGTYENCIGDLVHSVMIYDFHENRMKTLDKNDLAPFWNKRDSYFQHHSCFIIQCLFDASLKGEYEKILSTMLETKKKRYLKQPRNYPSAGSVFKRPCINGEPKYIWQLFDAVGLRGYRIGDAQISEKHPGFIVNRGNATGKEVVELMNYCKKVVKEQFGIQLEEEWKIL